MSAYSANGDKRRWALPDKNTSNAKVYEITENGNVFLGTAEIANGRILLDIKPKQALLIVTE